jgi:hypothetical protein
VSVDITTSPPGATILDGTGKLIDFTPWSASRARRRGSEKLRLEKDGFRPLEIVVPLDREYHRHFPLKKGPSW